MSLDQGPVSPNVPSPYPPGFNSPNYHRPLPPISGGPGTTVPYVIQPGDTLWALANQYHTTVQAIIDANPGIDPDNLEIGMTISIPGPPVETQNRIQVFSKAKLGYALCPRAYFVVPGDTLYSISAMSGIPMNRIIANNPAVHFGLPLVVGQFLCLS